MLGVDEGGIVNDGVRRVLVGIGIVAVAEIARIVIVQQIVVALFAARIDRMWKRLQIVSRFRPTPGWSVSEQSLYEPPP